MLTQRALLALTLLAATAGLITGCGQGEIDSGPTAAGSGAPAKSSGAAGAVPNSGAGGGSSTTR